jgi:hypothetical protein
MCVIYTCTNALPDAEELKRDAWRNDDGAGVSWLAPYPKKKETLVVHWQKGLKDDKAVLEYIRDEKIPFPLVIHFRTASVGSSSAELTHPFPVISGVPLWTAGYADQVLFHNGHLHGWEDLILQVGLPNLEKFPDGEWSDTRALAWLTYLKGPGILDFVIKGSRVALFYSDPDTLGTDKYDRATHHISHYGPGWVHKKGFSQSIETDYSNRGGYRVPDKVLGPSPVITPAAAAASPSATQLTLVKSAEESSKVFSSDVWTVEELQEVLKHIEEKQVDAKIATGI